MLLGMSDVATGASRGRIKNIPGSWRTGSITAAGARPRRVRAVTARVRVKAVAFAVAVAVAVCRCRASDSPGDGVHGIFIAGGIPILSADIESGIAGMSDRCS
jgi:hypothetical protein